jgi:hypothetical protein
MEWNKSEATMLANTSCVHCHGEGIRVVRKDQERPCNCVLRGVFRACYARFRHCVTKEKRMSKVSLQVNWTGRDYRMSYGRKDEEYIADFCLVSRRHLDDVEYKVFKNHFLLGADWKLCCRQMKIDRGTFFHAVYRIEQRLGRVFRELQPYGLYPLEDYFGTRVPREPSLPSNVTVMPSPAALRPPLRKIA